MDGEDVHSGRHSGVRELDLTIDTTGTKESRVQDIDTIRAHDHLKEEEEEEEVCHSI